MNQAADPRGLPRRLGNVWIKRENNEAAIFDPATRALHRLNPSALAIWELCDGETTIEDMAGAVSELTDVSIADATKDITATLVQLSELGLLDN